MIKTKSIIAALVFCAVICSSFAACGEKEENTPASVTTVSESESETTEKTEPSEIILNEENVKLTGRTALVDDILWCTHSGTGAEFTYAGKGFDLDLVGDAAASGGKDNQTRIAIYVDGEMVEDFMLDSPEKTVRIAESDHEKASEIKIIKLSETANSTFGIKPITIAEGESIVPAAQRELKIEFIGDSITCGYGVEDEVKEHHFSTTTENITKTYGYKTAELLNAEPSFVSMSGWGIISGYTNDSSKKADKQLVPLYYGKLGYSYQLFNETMYPQDIEWDFSSKKSDIIVINLGTNDNSYCKGDPDKCAEYREAYKTFLGDVRAKNPDAEIFCALGVMGAELYEDMAAAAKEFSDENGDEKIHSVKLPTQDGSTGFAADWHPTEATHEITANFLADEIKHTLQIE